MPKVVFVRIFVPFALGYFVVSIFRSINAVIAPDLVRELELGATGLGFAASAFFLSATLFQLPYGPLLDRYDPRWLYAALLTFSALGAAITALAQDVFTFALGRAFIALGAAGSAVTSYKVYSMWYPTERLPLANGLSLAAGGLGLMAGTAPVEIALPLVGWRGVHLNLAVVLVVCAMLVPMMAPLKQAERSGVTLPQQLKGLGVILRSTAFWRVAPLMMSVVGIFAAFAHLWAGPWVRDVAGLARPEAANLLLVLAGAMTVSGLVTGGCVSLAKRMGFMPMEFAVAMAGLFALVLIVLFLQWTPSAFAVFTTWALFGFLATLNFVIYAALGAQFPQRIAGALNACLTLSWMLGAFLIQNIYGIVLDRFPVTNGGYSIDGHQIAMGTMVAFVLVALAWFFACPHMIKKHVSGSIRGSDVQTG